MTCLSDTSGFILSSFLFRRKNCVASHFFLEGTSCEANIFETFPPGQHRGDSLISFIFHQLFSQWLGVGEKQEVSTFVVIGTLK